MLINICFDLYASVIECDIDNNIEDINIKLNNWLYEIKEDNVGKYMQIKESLNIDILDVYTIIRFFKEVYPNSNPSVKVEKMDITQINKDLFTINL